MSTEIIFGPPGTGKTTTLLDCVDEELGRGTAPDRIAYVSFTRRAADEAITRAVKKFGGERSRFPYFRTLHSLCFAGLGLRRSDVLTGDKLQQDFADYAKVRITGRWTEDGTYSGMADGDRILHIDNMARVRCIPLRKAYINDDPHVSWTLVEYVSNCLRAFKTTHGLLDYTDMLDEYIRLKLRLQLEVLIVDEGQDLSPLQWLVVNQLARGCRRVIVAGDDDQAIYQWAGADVNNLLQLVGASRVLHQSWRVPRQIQCLSTRLVGRIHNRREKVWKSRDAEGIYQRVTNLSQADFNGDDVLVLVRNEFLMYNIQSELQRQGIVYERHGHSSIKTSYLEAAEHWTHLTRGDAVTIDAARRVYSLMSMGRGVQRGYKTLPGRQDDELVTLEDLKRDGGLLIGDNVPWNPALDRIPADVVPYMTKARRRGIKLRERPAVRLSTIHSAKGAEADHVVLLREMAKRSYQETENNPDDELRVWYVGVTRAKEKLTLIDTFNMGCPWL